MTAIKVLRLRTFLSALGLTLLTVAASAQTPLSYTEDGKTHFTVSVPDFWEVRVGGPRILIPKGEDAEREVARVFGLKPKSADTVWIGFIVPRGVRTLEEGADYVREIGPHLVRDPVVTKREVRRIGGRTAHSITGKGRRGGRGVQFTAVLIDLPGPHVAFSVTVLENGFDPDLLGGINSVYDSFRAGQ
ncbi:hypothetical protein [Shimia gijangensis]|nr:hypothetical protein [Shimia gijangensis]